MPTSDRAQVLRIRSTQAGLLVPCRSRRGGAAVLLLMALMLAYLIKLSAHVHAWTLVLSLSFLALALAMLSMRRDLLFLWDGGVAVRTRVLGREKVTVYGADTIAGVDVITADARAVMQKARDTLVLHRRGDHALHLLTVSGADLLSPAREALYLRLASHYTVKNVPLGPGLARFATAPTAR